MTAPAAPDDLEERGRAFWTEIQAGYELSNIETQVLTECCRLMDECEALRRAILHDGATVTGSTGQVRAHPAIGEVRSHRLALGRLLAQLALPDEDGAALRSPTSARGRTAAQTRWAGSKVVHGV